MGQGKPERINCEENHAAAGDMRRPTDRRGPSDRGIWRSLCLVLEKTMVIAGDVPRSHRRTGHPGRAARAIGTVSVLLPGASAPAVSLHGRHAGGSGTVIKITLNGTLLPTKP